MTYDKSSKYQAVCFLDRDKSKIGGTIHQLPVYFQDSSPDKLKALRVEEIFIAIPMLEEARTKAMVEFYSSHDFKVKI